jgi:hypothetical protein
MQSHAEVVLKDDPQYGTCAFAARAFTTGQVVLNEDPLLISLKSDDPLLARAELLARPYFVYEWQYKAFTKDILPTLLAWCKATEDVKQRVLATMLHTPAAEFQTTIGANSCKGAAFIFCSKILPLLQDKLPASGRADASTYERVLLASMVNAHEIGDRCVL